jgi:GNAT superfamily N-acetyltransferase
MAAASEGDSFLYTSPEDERAGPLMDALYFEYESRYDADFPDTATSEMTRYPNSAFEPPDGAFLLLMRSGAAIGGGAFRRFDSCTAEFKRIWTDERFRRQGVGRTVLVELEAHALGRGYSRVFLTCGFRQPEAHALYFKAGYTPLFDPTEDPKVYGILPFVKALRPLARPLDAGLRWAARLDEPALRDSPATPGA